jgi:hypothetical protein
MAYEVLMQKKMPGRRTSLDESLAYYKGNYSRLPLSVQVVESHNFERV